VTASSAAGVTGLVLAGGLARRMGGEDKGLVQVGGRAMVCWVAGALAAQCERVLINANRNTERYLELTGWPVIADGVAGFAGPLAGMASGLAACTTPLLACAPCDSPLLAPDLVTRLRRALASEDAELAVAHDGERMQPVFVLLRRDLLADMSAFLAGGGRKIDAWYATRRIALAPFADHPRMFLNVNTPADRDALDVQLAAGGAGMTHTGAAVLGFAAWSGTGKTTLLRALIPVLRADGLRVGVVKHAHHSFDVDHPGKDSYMLRHAGAERVLIGSRTRWALMVEHQADHDEPDLARLLAHMPGAGLDLILVEGFKHEAFPKIELHRPALGRPLLHPHDASIIALASDAPLAQPAGLPLLDLNDVAAIAAFVRRFAAGAQVSR
jgi:molybdenum cofactor guanylyltransferase/molybdopterin-guanine dinucleotide biosynthesis protein MobB